MEDQWTIAKYNSEWKMSFLTLAMKLRNVLGEMRRKNPDKTKKYFRELPGNRRTHIYGRRTGSVSEQMTLLFRDYLRTHSFDCIKYAEEKHRLMKLHSKERNKYVEGKGPIVWEIIKKRMYGQWK